MKGACYVRVSTENQLENYSIEEQTDRLKSYCVAKDITVTDFYTDGGYSGGNLNRPALRRLIGDIENGQIDIVVVYKLDRLSRSQKDTLSLIEDKFLANQVDFISVNENFDTSTPFGKAMIGILSVFAQLEKDQITERFTMGRIGRAKSGLFHGGAYAPTGYDYQDGNLTVNEYEALQIRELFERFANGYSLHDCWLYMQKKYTTKYGSWNSESNVSRILRNEVYIGNISFKGKQYQGKHQPIVSADLFYEVQNIFDSFHKKEDTPRRHPFRAGALLSGLVCCGYCGARYHMEHGNYSCYSRTKGDKKYVADPSCKNKKWIVEDLNQLVITCLSNLQFSDLQPTDPAQRNTEVSIKQDYIKRLRVIEKQTEKLITLFQDGKISIPAVSERIELLNKERNAFLCCLAETVAAVGEANNQPAAKDSFLLLMESESLPEKRECLRYLINKIIINEENVTIILHKF